MHLSGRLFYFLFILFAGTFKIAFSQKGKPSFVLKGEYIIDNNKKCDGTLIGGLSGIEYCSGTIFYLISDDKGEHGPPRFYKVSINYNKKQGIRSVNFIAEKNLSPCSGKAFVSSPEEQTDTNKFIFSDGESIRYDKSSGDLLWSSEGFHTKGLCTQPFIFSMDTNGVFINKLNTDPVYRFDASKEKGLQHNAAFESLSIISGTDNIAYCTEKSLLQDINSLSDKSKPIRITIADKRSGNTIAQYAYMSDNVFNNNSNGVSEILALSADTLFVLERAYELLKGTSIRLYRVWTDNTTSNVKTLAELKDQKYVPLKKELLFDFSKAGLSRIDNIEGMTWGYPMKGNKKSILFVSDNNFNAFQVTQLLLFEYDGD